MDREEGAFMSTQVGAVIGLITLPKIRKPQSFTSSGSGSLRVLKSPTHFDKFTTTPSGRKIPIIGSKLTGSSAPGSDI